MASSVCCVVYASHKKLKGPVVVGELDAQGARGVEVTDRVRPGQQVPGVDQVGGAAEGGDLCKDSVHGGLQGDLQQVAEVSCRGEGPAFWRARISVSSRRDGRAGGPVRPGRPSGSSRTEAP